MNILTQLSSAAWSVLIELAPWLLAGVGVAGVLHVALPTGLVHTQLRGRWGVLKAVLLGVPLPLCSCGVIPAALGLRRDGASRGASVGFLISTPQTGIDSILVGASFLGWPFALFKVAAAAVTGAIGGWLADGVGRDDGSTPEPAPAAPLAPAPPRRGLREGFDHALEILRSIWIWIVLGIAVSAAIDVLVPARLIAGFGRLGSLGSGLAALVLSLPLYVCATASVPIAAALVAAGLPAGAALVFLMAGPATNVATVGAVLRTFGRRVLFAYLGTLVVGSLLAGMLFDSVLGGAGAASPSEMAGHRGGPLATVAAIVLLLLLAGFAVEWLALRLRRARPRAAPSPEVVELAVSGMSCSGCVRKVEQALRAVDGATRVEVSLQSGRALVYGRVDRNLALDAVRGSGFEAA